ncbi:MAG: hypothetical protein PHP54_02830 [Clostridia bacterium]|nr:hypothetical protein [Clostridia bacterium]
MKKKNGISLIYLVLLIVVTLIIVGTVIVNMDVPSESTKLSTFTNNVTQIQEAVRASYMLDGTIPQKDGTLPLTKDEVIARVYGDNREAFRTELILNNENPYVKFLELDLGKLGIKKERYGFGEKGADDIYVVTTDTLRVYYLYGTDYKGERYFSLNSKIASILDISYSEEDSSETTSTMYSGIFITKNNALATNDMGIHITANMSTGETLKIGFQGATERIITTNAEKNVFSFGNLAELNNLNILNSKFSATDINTFNSLSGSNKKIQITKYRGTDIVAKHVIDLSNYDGVTPSISDVTFTQYTGMKMLQGTASDADSGIEQVRYEYINKLDKKTPYYDGVINIDDVYMKNKAKSSEITADNKFTIKVPNDVGEIMIAVIDKAGNITRYTRSDDSMYKISTAMEQICQIHGRNYYKYNNEEAYVGVAYFYSDANPVMMGPVLVSTSESAVTYCTDHDMQPLTTLGSLTYNGKKYYYSSNQQWYQFTDCTTDRVIINSLANKYAVNVKDAAIGLLDKVFNKQ